jgi:hypothetical protein
MQTYDDTNERFECLDSSIKEMEKINKQLARLQLRKEELTQLVISAIGHEHDGQKSYEHGVWKIEVKTPFVYSLNKKLYESGEIELPKKFNPIKKSVAYSIDKRLCDKYIEEAPEEVRDILVELIEKRPGKAGVTIKERV